MGNIFPIFFLTRTVHIAFAGHVLLRKMTEIKPEETEKSEDELKNMKNGCRVFKVILNEVRFFIIIPCTFKF